LPEVSKGPEQALVQNEPAAAPVNAMNPLDSLLMELRLELATLKKEKATAGVVWRIGQVEGWCAALEAHQELDKALMEVEARKTEVLDWMRAEGEKGNLRQNCHAPAWHAYSESESRLSAAEAAHQKLLSPKP
jgi:hypothetical protein